MNEDIKKYYLIGEVAKITNLPVRTLHYYNDIGILIPAKIDSHTNYRYYSYEQIAIIHNIKFLKDANFTIKEMFLYLNSKDIHIKQNMLKSKQVEVLNKINILQQTNNKLSLFIDNTDLLSENDEIVVKHFPAAYYAYSRYKGSCSIEEFYLRFAKLLKIVKENNFSMIGTMQTVHHSNHDNFDYQNADIEVRIAIEENIIIDGVTKKEADCLVAATIHYGAYDSMSKSYIKLMKWLNDNSYLYLGHAIENYLIDIALTDNTEDYVTEILLPIKKL